MRGRSRAAREVGAIGVGLVACLASACASARPPSLADQFIQREVSKEGAAATYDLPGAKTAAAVTAPKLPDVPLEPVPKASDLPTVEREDPGLAAALGELKAGETASAHRRVAGEYRRLGVFDSALEHYTQAVKLDPRDAASYDGLARVWRDWGVAQMALPEAYRAVNLAPAWAEGQNTLGTVLFALGELDAATARFEKALALDPAATYALNNLCYVSLTRGDAALAADECRDAVRRAPDLTAARNNLALVYAASGQNDLAEQSFLSAGDLPTSRYNMGIVHLARKEYAQAAAAFEAACADRPSMIDACARARDARRLAGSTSPIIKK